MSWSSYDLKHKRQRPWAIESASISLTIFSLCLNFLTIRSKGSRHPKLLAMTVVFSHWLLAISISSSSKTNTLKKYPSKEAISFSITHCVCHIGCHQPWMASFHSVVSPLPEVEWLLVVLDSLTWLERSITQFCLLSRGGSLCANLILLEASNQVALLSIVHHVHKQPSGSTFCCSLAL